MAESDTGISGITSRLETMGGGGGVSAAQGPRTGI